MLLIYAAPIVILVLVLAVPIAYRYFWPIRLKRPRPFLLITLPTGLVVAGVAIYWFLGALVGIGVTRASAQAAAANAAFEAVLRNRLLVAAVVAMLTEYLLCRITQTIMDT